MLIPQKGPGRFWRLCFRSPVLFYRCGLHGLISSRILLLTTTGRKTGKPRTTPAGYRFDEAANTYYVVAGWKGRTNWYRNALANRAVRVQVGSLTFDATATPVEQRGISETEST